MHRTVTLMESETGEKFTTKTDSFGDFWPEKLKVRTYSLTIEKEGYQPKEIKSISTEKDVNRGDVELTKSK